MRSVSANASDSFARLASVLARGGFCFWSNAMNPTDELIDELVANAKEFLAAGDAYVAGVETDDIAMMLRFGEAQDALRASIAKADALVKGAAR